MRMIRSAKTMRSGWTETVCKARCDHHRSLEGHNAVSLVPGSSYDNIVYPSKFYDRPSRMNVQFNMNTHALRRTASGRFSQTTDASVSKNSGLAAGKVNWNGK